MNKKFEYKVVYINTDLCRKETVEHQLNELGNDGWELVTVDSNFGWYYLMREKRKEEPVKVKNTQHTGDRYSDVFDDLMGVPFFDF